MQPWSPLIHCYCMGCSHILFWSTAECSRHNASAEEKQSEFLHGDNLAQNTEPDSQYSVWALSDQLRSSSLFKDKADLQEEGFWHFSISTYMTETLHGI